MIRSKVRNVSTRNFLQWPNYLIHSVDKTNRPLPICFEPHYESEAKCKVFVMKISFYSYANKTNFHMKSFASSLAFIVRFTATRKKLILKMRASARFSHYSSEILAHYAKYWFLYDHERSTQPRSQGRRGPWERGCDRPLNDTQQ